MFMLWFLGLASGSPELFHRNNNKQRLTILMMASSRGKVGISYVGMSRLTISSANYKRTPRNADYHPQNLPSLLMFK